MPRLQLSEALYYSCPTGPCGQTSAPDTGRYLSPRTTGTNSWGRLAFTIAWPTCPYLPPGGEDSRSLPWCFFTPCLISPAGKELWAIPGAWHPTSSILPAARSSTQPTPLIHHPPVNMTSHLSGDSDAPATYVFWSFSNHPGDWRGSPARRVRGGGGSARRFGSRLSFQQVTCKWNVGKVVSRSSSGINQQSPTKDIKALLVYTIWEFGRRGGLLNVEFLAFITVIHGRKASALSALSKHYQPLQRSIGAPCSHQEQNDALKLACVWISALYLVCRLVALSRYWGHRKASQFKQSKNWPKFLLSWNWSFWMGERRKGVQKYSWFGSFHYFMSSWAPTYSRQEIVKNCILCTCAELGGIGLLFSERVASHLIYRPNRYWQIGFGWFNLNPPKLCPSTSYKLGQLLG